MAIDFSGLFNFGSAAQALTRLSLVAARPNFELQFNIAQNKALERLDKEIQKFQESDFGRGKTALLRVKAKRLDLALEAARTFKKAASTNRQTVKDVLAQLDELRGFADSSTVAEFDAKRSETLSNLDKLITTTTHLRAAPDGLRDAKAEAIAALEGIVHNDFATAEDVTAAQDTIDQVTANLTTRLSLLEINQDIATSIVTSADRTRDEVLLKIDDIEIAERKKQIDRVQELQAELGRVFSSLSLAFESFQGFGDYLAQNTVLKRKIEPGSVLNLFS